jgi:hypothetical protein
VKGLSWLSVVRLMNLNLLLVLLLLFDVRL